MTDTPLKTAPFGAFKLHAAAVEDASTQVLARLATLYTLLQPEKSFTEDICRPLITSTPDNPARLTYQTFEDARHTNYTFGALIQTLCTSCAYALHASAAEEMGENTEAWSHLANAQYYLGLLEGMLIVEPALTHILVSQGKAGGNKRSQKLEPLKQRARELAGQRPYKSKRQAALAIKDEIVAMSKRDDIRVNLSPDRAEKTITEWLKGMTFGDIQGG